MSLYAALRFKGIVKKELREIFEPIAMEGLWRESPDDFLRKFGKANRISYAIPCYNSHIIEWWQKEPWECSYNKETGEWIFQSDINQYSFPFDEWMDEIVPYCMESVSHFETWFEDFDYYSEYTCLEKYENGEYTILGHFYKDGTFTPAEEEG